MAVYYELIIKFKKRFNYTITSNIPYFNTFPKNVKNGNNNVKVNYIVCIYLQFFANCKRAKHVSSMRILWSKAHKALSVRSIFDSNYSYKFRSICRFCIVLFKTKLT